MLGQVQMKWERPHWWQNIRKGMQDMRRKIVMYYSAGIMNHTQECLKYSIHTHTISLEERIDEVKDYK